MKSLQFLLWMAVASMVWGGPISLENAAEISLDWRGEAQCAEVSVLLALDLPIDHLYYRGVALNGVKAIQQRHAPVSEWLKNREGVNKPVTSGYRFTFPVSALRRGANRLALAAVGRKVTTYQAELDVDFEREIVVENDACRLTLGRDASVKSLVVKHTGVECVDAGMRLPAFSVSVDRPFHNEVKLIQPNKATTYPAVHLRRRGDMLYAGFEHDLYEAKVQVIVKPGYLGFKLVDFPCDRRPTYDYLKMDLPPVAAFRLLQLPVKDRANFGDWLNACWDEQAAVAVVGTSPHPDIDHEKRAGVKILFGDARRGIRLRGAEVALIAAPGREAFLDAMDALECDYGLPRGVKSRRSPEISEFIFHLSQGFSPATVDELIGYAKKGGFRLVTMNMGDVTKEIGSWGRFGDYEMRTDHYPNGLDDLRAVLAKFHAAGIKVGLHTLHSHIGLKSHYVTPVADPRLNKTRRFTLAEALPKNTNDLASITVFEPTADVTRFPACRVLQFGGELLSYEDYTEEPPYRFLGVKRCAWNTLPAAHPRGEVGGILDISEYGSPMSCYVDQNTDLQDEVAETLAKYYNCGFDYIYLDGSEGVNAPFNYHVANAQWRVWKRLVPEPILAEGAAKTHFGWHMLSGANAFDCFSPVIFKEKLREYPFKQAPVTAQDMSRVDFGWWGCWAPGSRDWWGKDKGVQADMWEYGAGVATAWNCAGAILMPLNELRKHPRIDDILETMRRWADLRRKGLLKDEWRAALKNYDQEHHLLLLPDGSYDLVAYEQLSVKGDKEGPVRAFVFERGGETWVVYWHCSSEGELKLAASGDGMALYDDFAASPIHLEAANGVVKLPCGKRRYLKCTLPKAAVVELFAR